MNKCLPYCIDCFGTGELHFKDKRSMIEYLWEDFMFDEGSFLKFVKNNLKFKTKGYYIVVCQTCGGKGNL